MKQSIKIEDTIIKAGYKVHKELRHYVFKIEGMSCAACANRVEKIVKRQVGIEQATVNFASEKLLVSLDEEIITVEQIKEKVEKAGFKLVTLETEKEKSNTIDEDKKLFWRFIISIGFTIPLLMISMGHLIGMALPKIINPMINPFNFALVQIC